MDWMLDIDWMLGAVHGRKLRHCFLVKSDLGKLRLLNPRLAACVALQRLSRLATLSKLQKVHSSYRRQ